MLPGHQMALITSAAAAALQRRQFMEPTWAAAEDDDDDDGAGVGSVGGAVAQRGAEQRRGRSAASRGESVHVRTSLAASRGGRGEESFVHDDPAPSWSRSTQGADTSGAEQWAGLEQPGERRREQGRGWQEGQREEFPAWRQREAPRFGEQQREPSGREQEQPQWRQHREQPPQRRPRRQQQEQPQERQPQAPPPPPLAQFRAGPGSASSAGRSGAGWGEDSP